MSRCIFVDGVEVASGPDCPHGRTEDELGEVKPPGWTAQQAPSMRGPHSGYEDDQGR